MHLLYGTQTKENRLEIIVSPFCSNKRLANNYSRAWRLKGNQDILHFYKRYYVYNPASLNRQIAYSF